MLRTANPVHNKKSQQVTLGLPGFGIFYRDFQFHRNCIQAVDVGLYRRDNIETNQGSCRY